MTTPNTTTTPAEGLIREMLERRAARGQVAGLLSAIVREVEATPTRPRGVRGAIQVRPSLRTGSLAFASVVAAVAVIGALVLRPVITGPGASPSPLPTATAPGNTAPSPTPGVPTITVAGIDGPPLAGGTWQSASYEPTVRFTVPDGVWTAGVDLPRQLWLRGHLPGAADTDIDAVTLLTVQNVYVEPCERGPVETRPWDPAGGPDAFLDWLEAEGDFSMGPRTPVTVLGSTGLQVEFTAPDLSHCAGGYLAITDNGRSSPFGTGPAGVRIRYAVIDLLGQTVVVGTWTTDPARRDAVWAAADAVVASIEIEE